MNWIKTAEKEPDLCRPILMEFDNNHPDLFIGDFRYSLGIRDENGAYIAIAGDVCQPEIKTNCYLSHPPSRWVYLP